MSDELPRAAIELSIKTTECSIEHVKRDLQMLDIEEQRMLLDIEKRKINLQWIASRRESLNENLASLQNDLKTATDALK